MRGLVGVCHAVAYPPMLGLLGAYIPPGIPRLMGFGGLTVGEQYCWVIWVPLDEWPGC